MMTKSYRYGCTQGIVMPIGGLFFAGFCTLMFFRFSAFFVSELVSKGYVDLPAQDLWGDILG